MHDFKDVNIGDKEYRIGKLKAQDGGWIVVTLTSKMRDQAQNEQPKTAKAKRAAQQDADSEAKKMTYEEGMMMTAAFFIAQLSRAELADVQSACLARCFQRQEQAGKFIDMPVCVDGQWTVPELEYDGPTILELTKHSLAFNIAPFFPAPASS